MEEISVKNRLELMNVLPSEACGEVFTRADVANNVLKLLKAKPGVFSNPNYRFLDIYTKSGVFLLLIYSELMQGLVEAIPDPEIRSQHILGKMIYGISPSVETALISRKTLYGDWSIQGNIKVITGYKNDTGKRTFSNVSKEFNGMKFDVVIGNPPYNRGMDIDFVNLGYELSTKYCCMITPAKWQTAEADQKIASKMSYGEFRKKLVPHMSHVVFYPDCKDVFDIDQADGITYFLMDKDQHTKCEVYNKCKLFDGFNSKVARNITDSTLINIGNSIVDYLGDYDRFKFSKTGLNKRYRVCANTQIVLGKTSRSLLFSNENNALVIGILRLLDSDKSEQYESSASQIIFASDDIDVCKSFISWLNCKFTKFFVLINISKMTGIMTDHCFRFVPAPTVLDANGNRVPGKFDHIYTDEELYKTFNLPQEYIDVIESVIKERKQTEDK